MSAKYKTVVTTAGAVKLAAATVPGGKKVNLTVMAVGDGGGSLPEPNASQTTLVNEVWRYTLNKISQDNKKRNYIVAELVIPPEVGGFWARELGLYDDAGTLIAVANMAESYKPELAEGSGRAQTCRMVIVLSSIESVELSIDSTTVMATQDYVDDKIAGHEQSRRHPDATLKEKGFVQLSSATDSSSEALAATPKAVKVAYDLANAKYTAQDATTARKGIVQLSSATNSTSEVLAATPKAVKAAYDLADGKYTAQDATTARKGIVQLSNTTDSESEVLAATPKAVKAANDNANERVPSTRKVNNKALSGDITLSADDVVAVPSVIRGVINGSMTMASANKSGWWQVAVPDTSKSSDFPKKPDGSRLYGYGYMFVWVTGNTWFQHYIAHHGEVAYRQAWEAGPSASVEWTIDYNTANKPAAAEVDAVSASVGGTFKGVVYFNNVVRIEKTYPGLTLRDTSAADSLVGKDILLEASGGNVRLLFRKKDSTDNQLMLSFPKVAGTLYSTGNKPSAGDVGAYSKAECDARYVVDVQLGAGTSKTTWNASGNWPKTAGYVITSVWKDAMDQNLDGVVYAPLQKKIGSTWYTVSGGLA
ncbi:tail fiber protein [Kluyvera intermedia]|uniref:tail fiber protein n=2 Tax=Kluyvera intermedia TaxID=61648 RepID=UPI00372D7F7B